MSPIDFTLFAPTISQATLIGSFSQWQDISMHLENGRFHCSVDLNDGDYQYKFRIQRKNDQSTIDVVDPYVKHYDPERNVGCITIKNGQIVIDDYVWQFDQVELPANDDLIIYEIYIGDFTEQGTFLGAIERLNYLQDLGVNAVELMPVQESMGIDHDWGYSTRHHFALKKPYGTTNDFKQFIDQCHRRRIRVFIDVVFNHTAADCPLKMIDHDYWYYHDKHHPEDPFYWGPEFNYEYYDEQQQIKPACTFACDVVRYWIEEFHLDGIRFDAAKQLDNYDILRELDAIGRSVRQSQPFYTSAEYVPETMNIVKSHQGPMDVCWSSTFHGVIGNNLVDLSKFEIDLLKYVIGTSDLVNYLSCHDNERLPFLLARDGHASEEDTFRRMRLAMIILMSSVSLPFLYQGDEFGENRELGEENKTKKCLAMQWNLLDHPHHRGLFDICKRLIAWRHQRTDLKEHTIQFIYEHYEDHVLAYARSDQLVVITHFCNEEKSKYGINNFPQDGQWIDWLTNEEYHVENHRFEHCLKPFDGKVLVLKK